MAPTIPGSGGSRPIPYRRRGRRALAAGALALLLAAACTTDDEPGDAAPTDGVVAEPAVDDGSSGSAPDERSDAEGADATDDGPGDGDGDGDGDGLVEFEEIPDLVDRVIGSVLAVQTPTGGEGSGVVFDDDGTAVTNAHVVGGHSEVRVLTSTGRTMGARVIGTDPYTDLAVLQLEDADLPALDFADELPRVGSLAVAIGNPLGFEGTVSVGVVSGLERSIPGGAPSLIGLLQTDAAISPGNSGGALLGNEGSVIGINVAYLPPQSRAVSIGFAIPSPVVIDVVEQLRAGQPVQHSFVGIQPLDVTPQVAAQLGLPEADGVVVVGVVPGAPADQAGLQPRDVIVALDGQGFSSVSDFLLTLREYDPGETVEATVLRGGEEITVPLTLTQRPDVSG